MFFFAAFLDDNVRAYHLTTVRAVPDWGVGAPVIQVRTPFSLHCADPLSISHTHCATTIAHPCASEPGWVVGGVDG